MRMKPKTHTSTLTFDFSAQIPNLKSREPPSLPPTKLSSEVEDIIDFSFPDMASKIKKSTGPATPVKALDMLSKSNSSRTPEVVENRNPNLASRSPSTKSAKSVKSATRNPNLPGKKKAVSPKKEKLESGADGGVEEEKMTAVVAGDGKVVLPKADAESGEGSAMGGQCGVKFEVSESGGRVKSGVCRSNIKRGKVMNLIQAFERILTLPPGSNADKGDDDCTSEAVNKIEDWHMLESPETTQDSSSFHSDLFETPESMNSDTCGASSWDGSHSQESISKRTSGGGRRSRRNSSESSGTSGVTRSKKKQLKITNQKPFKLRTEQRGKAKELELLSRIQQMIEEQERKRVRIAQGLPWTTDEPQCLVKPPVKEITRPMDVKLHTDMRAAERAEFDHQVAEKMSLFEQYKMERVRKQKLAEEEEIRRLRKELVPKAQPMPYFDKPFVPKRASKHQENKEPDFKSHNAGRSDAAHCS